MLALVSPILVTEQGMVPLQMFFTGLRSSTMIIETGAHYVPVTGTDTPQTLKTRTPKGSGFFIFFCETGTYQDHVSREKNFISREIFTKLYIQTLQNFTL